jgi:hypothetical protein
MGNSLLSISVAKSCPVTFEGVRRKAGNLRTTFWPLGTTSRSYIRKATIERSWYLVAKRLMGAPMIGAATRSD